jgi:hypothetical protein
MTHYYYTQYPLLPIYYYMQLNLKQPARVLYLSHPLRLIAAGLLHPNILVINLIINNHGFINNS